MNVCIACREPATEREAGIALRFRVWLCDKCVDWWNSLGMRVTSIPELEQRYRYGDK